MNRRLVAVVGLVAAVLATAPYSALVWMNSVSARYSYDPRFPRPTPVWVQPLWDAIIAAVWLPGRVGQATGFWNPPLDYFHGPGSSPVFLSYFSLTNGYLYGDIAFSFGVWALALFLGYFVISLGCRKTRWLLESWRSSTNRPHSTE